MAVSDKRLLLLLILTIVIIVVYKSVFLQSDDGKKQLYKKHIDYVSEFVTSNNDYLNQIVKNIQNNTVSEEAAEKELNAYGIDAKVELQENGNVEFMCVGEGFVSNSRYYGFFYSIDNDIKRLSWYNDEYKNFSEIEQGFYSDDGTDNYIYIEQISQHWYYYCAGF